MGARVLSQAILKCCVMHAIEVYVIYSNSIHFQTPTYLVIDMVFYL